MIDAVALACAVIHRAALDAIGHMGDMKSSKNSRLSISREMRSGREFCLGCGSREANKYSAEWFNIAGVSRPRNMAEVERIANVGYSCQWAG